MTQRDTQVSARTLRAVHPRRPWLSQRARKFFSYYKPYLSWVALDLFCALLLSVITLMFPLCISYITKTILASEAPNKVEQIAWVGALMFGLIVLHTVCNTVVDYQGHMIGSRMESDMRGELFDHYQKLSFRFYDEHKTGQLMSSITNDTFDLSELYHHGPEDVIISVLNFIGACIVLMQISVPLTLITLLFMPLMAIYAVYFNGKMKHALRLGQDRIGDINAQIEDTLAGVRVVRSFTNELIERGKFAHANQRFLDSRRASHKSEAYFYGGLIAFTQLMTVAVVVFGGIGIVRDTLDLADLLTFVLYIGILIEPIKRFGNFTRLYQEGMAGFNRFMDFLLVEPDIRDTANALELTHVRGDITLRNVSFRYSSSYDDVLRNVSLDIQAGEYIALVGVSGVGKTTLCSLIPRFYDVTTGEVLLDGQDIRTVSLKSLRQQIGIVQQDSYLFAGSIADNIRYGNPTASDAEIVAAAKQAHAHEFIMNLPHGYNTDIGQRGVKLSGGQKQRLSIARVFLKNPPIIIFDEATSALDNESERAVRDSLELLANNRTTLVIAHRLSTVRHAHRIVVLTDAGISEQGTHEELLALNGVYAYLYAMHLNI